MNIIISNSKQELGKKAAITGAKLIRKAIKKKNEATIIVATGASQFEMLGELVQQDIDWSKVMAFHLDEYIGIPETHPASFRKYLKERFADMKYSVEKERDTYFKEILRDLRAEFSSLLTEQGE